MANVETGARPRGSMLPWLVALAVLILVVGWLLWRNNRLPALEGAAPRVEERPLSRLNPGSRSLFDERGASAERPPLSGTPRTGG